MNEGFVFQWPLLIIPLVVLAYFELLRRLDNRWSKRTPLTDEEILSHYARSKAISEFDVFGMAAPNWSVNHTTVEADFKVYLQEGILPHYVRDFIRRIRLERNY